MSAIPSSRIAASRRSLRPLLIVNSIAGSVSKETDEIEVEKMLSVSVFAPSSWNEQKELKLSMSYSPLRGILKRASKADVSDGSLTIRFGTGEQCVYSKESRPLVMTLLSKTSAPDDGICGGTNAHPI